MIGSINPADSTPVRLRRCSSLTLQRLATATTLNPWTYNGKTNGMDLVGCTVIGLHDVVPTRSYPGYYPSPHAAKESVRGVASETCRRTGLRSAQIR